MERAAEIPRQPPETLVALIRTALSKSNMSTRQVALAAGVAPSQLTEFLAGRKGMSTERLMNVANVLNLAPEAIQQALDDGAPSAVALQISNVVLQRSPNLRQVRCVTDARVYDGALFLWLCNKQPFKAFNIEFIPDPIDWAYVPSRIASFGGIGFYNRRAGLSQAGTTGPDSHEMLRAITPAIDLSLYRGYALVARKEDAVGHPEEALARMINRAKAERRKLQIMSIGGDVYVKFMNWRHPSLMTLDPEAYEVLVAPNPDMALSWFVQQRMGDLFAGGLPQRVRAINEYECEALVTSDDDPTLFTINSLVCQTSFFEQGELAKPLLTALAQLWFNTIKELKDNLDYRNLVCSEIPALLDDLGVMGHSIREDDLQTLFRQNLSGDWKDELFPTTPTDIVDGVYRMLALAVSGMRKEKPDEKASQIAPFLAELENIFRPTVPVEDYPKLLL